MNEVESAAFVPDTLPLPTSIEAGRVGRIARAARRRQRGALAISAVVAIVTSFFIYLGAAGVAELVVTIPRMLQVQAAYDRGEIPWQEYLMVGVYQNTIVLAVVVYIGLFVLPFIVSLPIAAPLVLLWQRPARLLFLRPFNRRPLTRGLSRLVRRDVARFGHVYTLADADLRVRWYVRVPALLGQIALLSFRARKVRRPRQLSRLERAINRTWLRNINWCLSWRKVFAVASDDSCWQQVVERLLHRSTLIFIDLTEARPNVLWEIDLIRRMGLERRVVWLLARTADETTSADWRPPGEPIFRYDDSGIVDRTAFGATVAQRIADVQGEPARQPAVTLLSIAALLMFGLGCFPLLALWLEGPAEWLANLWDGLPMAIIYFGLATFAAFLVVLRKNRNAIFFVVVQLLLLLVAFLGPLPVEAI